MTDTGTNMEEIRRWAAGWARARAGVVLEHVRRREVRGRSEADFMRECDEVNEVYAALDIAAMPERPCGMVEMQKIFKRMAGRMNKSEEEQ